MENTIFSGGQDVSAAYDYRVYDKVWQRVSPGVDPYAGDPYAGDAGTESAPVAPAPGPSGGAVPSGMDIQPAQPAPAQEGGEGDLPGAERNPCCMGTEAQGSLAVLEGFIEEELAGCRCCLSLSKRVSNQNAARLLRRIVGEKQAAARELCAARFLITGQQYAPAITVEHRRWENLAQALRSCYHQEACGGFNYQRAADEAVDHCLQKLFTRLGERASRRAGEVMELLGCLLC